MTEQSFGKRITSLLERWNGHEIDIVELGNEFERIAYSAGFQGRQLPEDLLDLVNQVEIVRFTEVEKNQQRAIALVLEAALKLNY